MKVFAEDEAEMAIGSYMPAKHMNLAHPSLSINQHSLSHAHKEMVPQVLTPTKNTSVQQNIGHGA